MLISNRTTPLTHAQSWNAGLHRRVTGYRPFLTEYRVILLVILDQRKSIADLQRMYPVLDDMISLAKQVVNVPPRLPSREIPGLCA